MRLPQARSFFSLPESGSFIYHAVTEQRNKAPCRHNHGTDSAELCAITADQFASNAQDSMCGAPGARSVCHNHIPSESCTTEGSAHLDCILGSAAVTEDAATHTAVMPSPHVREWPSTSRSLTVAHILVVHPTVFARSILTRPTGGKAYIATTTWSCPRACRPIRSPRITANHVQSICDRGLPGAPPCLVLSATSKCA